MDYFAVEYSSVALGNLTESLSSTKVISTDVKSTPVVTNVVTKNDGAESETATESSEPDSAADSRTNEESGDKTSSDFTDVGTDGSEGDQIDVSGTGDGTTGNDVIKDESDGETATEGGDIEYAQGSDTTVIGQTDDETTGGDGTDSGSDSEVGGDDRVYARSGGGQTPQPETSDNGIDLYEWDFDDNTIGTTGAIVKHAYSEPGEYDVSLTITGSGTPDTATVTITVTNDAQSEQLIANDDNAIVSVNSINNPIFVLDNDEGYDRIESTTDPENGIVNLEESHLIYTPDSNFYGEDSFSYIISDGAGDTASASVYITVNSLPNADFIATPDLVFLGDSISFDGSSSSDLDGTITKYKWTFDDGNTKTGEAVSHKYTEEGYYNVKLTVTDNNGGTSSASINVAVVASDNPPIADASGPYFGYINEPITFNGSNSTGDGEIISHEWDFGDGNTSDQPITNHSYATPGNYTVTLEVTDDGGKTGKDTTFALIISENRPPNKPKVEVLPVDNIENEYTFTAASEDPDGDMIHYVFDWDDGTNTTSPLFPSGTVLTATHTWKSDGIYIVKIYAQDEHNETSEVNKINITIGDPSNSGNSGVTRSSQTGGALGFLNEEQAELLYKMIAVVLTILGIIGVMIYLYKKKGAKNIDIISRH